MKQRKMPGIFELQLVSTKALTEKPQSLQEITERIGIPPPTSHRFIESLPFSINDTTAGAENELQAVVHGGKDSVDLPLTIQSSNYYANIMKRIASGEAPRRVVSDLEKYLHSNPEEIWEHSWVRFPMRLLSRYAAEVLEHDLRADKQDPESRLRADVARFIFYENGEKCIRVPISYLLKLALANVLGTQEDAPPLIGRVGARLLRHFSSDNTSPETYSFHVVALRPDSGMGRAIAKETATRFLLTQLLMLYANECFMLRAGGQRAIVYFAPHPPVRQKELNNCISDAFYRELYMSPCLAGWDKGEEKHSYMCLCHQVLSRSQLNAVAKLREAGIITNNLVVLPNVSNVSLANNGTHLSLGSLRLSALLADRTSGLTRADEKYLGDLVIKIVEHFLPLFVGTYSAAPFRMDFSDFHPERALGFLPHELDYTHLRMIWRRWKNKANLKILGRPLTPFGPGWLDRIISGMFRLRGDYVPDFRLIDYFVALMSTDRSPALDGTLGNGERLKRDLAELGVFDAKMALYLIYRLREFHVMGFSGFEGRHYSVFESLGVDMARAADLQTLVTALAFKYLAAGKVIHEHIPDTPSVESERRQIFFGAAIGIPTFYVRNNTRNVFLKGIVEHCERVRHSRRYPNYFRVYNFEYRKALLKVLREEARDLIEMLGLEDSMRDLAMRLEMPEEYSTFGKLNQAVVTELNTGSAMRAGAMEFNQAAEKYYRDDLRKKHLLEAFRFLEEDIRAIESETRDPADGYGRELGYTLPDGLPAEAFVAAIQTDVLEERASAKQLIRLINLVLLTIHRNARHAERTIEACKRDETLTASVHRAANG